MIELHSCGGKLIFFLCKFFYSATSEQAAVWLLSLPYSKDGLQDSAIWFEQMNRKLQDANCRMDLQHVSCFTKTASVHILTPLYFMGKVVAPSHWMFISLACTMRWKYRVLVFMTDTAVCQQSASHGSIRDTHWNNSFVTFPWQIQQWVIPLPLMQQNSLHIPAQHTRM